MSADEAGRLAELLATKQAAARRELEEIELLMRQARTEADRHATRREAASERLAGLMDQHSVAAEVREAHEGLVVQHQRSALMTAQMEVLEGKAKVLQRLESSLGEVIEALETAGVTDVDGTPANGGGTPIGADASPISSARGQASSVLTAQEDMRRVIARQMHDGPAQSIANIALQAEVVQRLLARDPADAQRELTDLRGMVQHALEATKSFIFEVRPMVLDDLGLLPTLRRAAGEHQRRSGVPVRFESAGPERRLEPQVETQLFRVIDDALVGYTAKKPKEVHLRLNWSESEVRAHIRTVPVASDRTAPPSGASNSALPEALQAMISQQDAAMAASTDAHAAKFAMDTGTVSELKERAFLAGLVFEELPDRLGLDLSLAVN